MNLMDLSVWCYGCDMYLQHEFFPRLHRFFSKLHELKHHEQPPNLKENSVLELPYGSFDSSGTCPDIASVTDAYKTLRSMNSSCATCQANNVPRGPNMAYREDW
eukprot:CAMPEP_0184552044 /NCGR_PEP_ID=MMETSP0199_2-20130426/27533_1 /TAXON_ID=1112570 /ORGANISM="Thraustochytrium sp., Strain LLF1b" /LENGTH=103 /DNA_ID=CAMNT_0026947417 /DNA_START=96 /DNA_END=404 /DNA_ORIENTATION=+